MHRLMNSDKTDVCMLQIYTVSKKVHSFCGNFQTIINNGTDIADRVCNKLAMAIFNIYSLCVAILHCNLVSFRVLLLRYY